MSWFMKEPDVALAEKTRQEIERREIEKRNAAELAEKEFDGLRSICLDCKNAFWQKFIPNPETPDPLDLICVKKIAIWGSKAVNLNAEGYLMECREDRWSRKVLDCSDFEKR